MASATIRPILIACLLLGLFTYSILTFYISLPVANGVNQSIGDDPALSSFKTSLSNNLSTAYSDSKDSYGTISNSSVTIPSTGTGGIIIDAISGIWKTMVRTPIAIYNLIADFVFIRIFGSNEYAMVLGVVGAILLVSISLAVYYFVLRGEGG